MRKSVIPLTNKVSYVSRNHFTLQGTLFGVCFRHPPFDNEKPTTLSGGHRAQVFHVNSPHLFHPEGKKCFSQNKSRTPQVGVFPTELTDGAEMSCLSDQFFCVIYMKSRKKTVGKSFSGSRAQWLFRVLFV